MSSVSQVPTLYDLAPALQGLAWWLLNNGYSQHDAEAIVARVEDAGELASAVAAGLLAAEDEGAATDVYVEALPPVSFDSAAWGEDDEDRPTAEEPPYDPTPDDLADYMEWSAAVEARQLGMLLPAISGGAPEPDEDLAAERDEALAYDRFLDELAEERAAEDHVTGNPWF